LNITLQQTTAQAVTTFDRLTRFAIASHKQTSSGLAQTLCKNQALASFRQPLKLGIRVVVTTTSIQKICTSAFLPIIDKFVTVYKCLPSFHMVRDSWINSLKFHMIYG
jgi:hypothetical protein